MKTYVAIPAEGPGICDEQEIRGRAQIYKFETKNQPVLLSLCCE
jgi:hypothetical protein